MVYAIPNLSKIEQIPAELLAI